MWYVVIDQCTGKVVDLIVASTQEEAMDFALEMSKRINHDTFYELRPVEFD